MIQPMFSVKKYLSESKAELKKFTFPSKLETNRSTWGVLIIIFMVSLYLFFVDIIFKFLVGSLLP